MKKIYHYLYYCFYVLVTRKKSHGDSYENKASFIFSFFIAQLSANSIKLVVLLRKYNLPIELITLILLLALTIPYSSIYFNKKYFVDSKLFREIRDYHNINSSKAWAKFIGIFFMCFSILSFLLIWPSSGWKK
jgi:hypothetical protein